VHALDPDLPLFNIRTLDDHIETNLMFRRIPARMFLVLGPMLLILAAIGIYAAVSHNVAQRTKELGIRLALGATTLRVVRQVMGDTLGIVGIGALAGWLAAFVVVVDFAPGNALDMRVFAAAPTLLLLVATAACWIPARRAGAIDPAVTLRN
jgi:ABC-type antimicrobial peptide transport system permease subunit